MGKTQRNELRRAAGNFFNGLGIACLSLGLIAPSVNEGSANISLSVTCLVLGLALHLCALAVAGRTED